ncbi:hypothetical protein, partial [uncultured Aureimonas sp.]|uniref:hypothetical protein n=1 Tax=uncultured Aureimonas sp. TaxID=1604662 RepID=UPI0025EF4F56
MAAQTTTMDGEIPALGERRRFMLVPGILAVIGALVTGAISFVVLMGLTPIAPTAAVVKTATVVNGVFVLLLCV